MEFANWGSDAMQLEGKETVRSLIRNTLEGLLNKPPLLGRKVFDAFVQDLEERQTILASESDLRNYLEAKFLKKMPSKVAVSIVRSLWKLVFFLEDARAEANRDINLRALHLLYERHREEVLANIRDNLDHYSHISSTRRLLRLLVKFLAVQPEVWEHLTDAAKIPVRQYCETSGFGQALCWFLNGDLAGHLDGLCERASNGHLPSNGPPLKITESGFLALNDLAEREGLEQKVYLFGVELYGASGSYDMADTRFSKFIKPYVSHWDKGLFSIFSERVNDNAQTWERRWARRNHRLVTAAYEDRFNEDFPLPDGARAAETFKKA